MSGIPAQLLTELLAMTENGRKGVIYEIKVEGVLDDHWAEWFDGLHVLHDSGGNTLLYGELADQAALHGALAKIRDLGLTLLSVNPRLL